MNNKYFSLIDDPVELWYHFPGTVSCISIILLVHYFSILPAILIAIFLELVFSILKYVIISSHYMYYRLIARGIYIWGYNIANLIYCIIIGEIWKGFIPLAFYLFSAFLYFPLLYLIDIFLVKKITGLTAKEWGFIKLNNLENQNKFNTLNTTYKANILSFIVISFFIIILLLNTDILLLLREKELKSDIVEIVKIAPDYEILFGKEERMPRLLKIEYYCKSNKYRITDLNIILEIEYCGNIIYRDYLKPMHIFNDRPVKEIENDGSENLFTYYKSDFNLSSMVLPIDIFQVDIGDLNFNAVPYKVWGVKE